MRSSRVAGKTLVLFSLALLAFLLTGAASWAQSHLQPGQRAVVFGVGPEGLAVREGPGIRFPVVEVIPAGTGVDVLDGPNWSSHIPWYQIEGYSAEGGSGWSAGSFLQPVPEENPEPEVGERERTASARGGRGDGRSFIALVTGYAIRGRTATGVTTEWGVVAVDPSVVPLGSRIQIEGFEETFVAADTGSGVKGTWIDIWFPDYAEARQFGIQSRRVTVLEP